MNAEEFSRKYSWKQRRLQDFQRTMEKLNRASYSADASDSLFDSLRLAVNEIVGAPRQYKANSRSTFPNELKKFVQERLELEIDLLRKDIRRMEEKFGDIEID